MKSARSAAECTSARSRGLNAFAPRFRLFQAILYGGIGGFARSRILRPLPLLHGGNEEQWGRSTCLASGNRARVIEYFGNLARAKLGSANCSSIDLRGEARF